MLHPNPTPHGQSAPTWNRGHEIRAVGLLALGFGIVGLDRFIINPLFPMMQKDLGLNYQDLGLISAVLALTWGAAAILAGRLADRWGPRRVLIPSVVIFSLLVATSGLATGLFSLLLIRGLMGLAEGAFAPASIVATTQASKPSRIGMNVGIQQMAAPLVGLGFGPLIAVGLLKVLPSWHWVFGMVAIPGLLLAFAMARVLPRSVHQDEAPATQAAESMGWRQLLGLRVVRVNTALMMCSLTCLITLSAFMPSYLTDHLHLGMGEMGMVLAAQGVGSFIGMVTVPALSDVLGRKSVVVGALLVELFALLWLPRIGADPAELFAALFAIAILSAGVVAIAVGPLTSESVPAPLVSSATGVVVGVGEIVGGAVAPAVTGALAQQAGITVVPTIALIAIALGLGVSLFTTGGRRLPRLDTNLSS